MEREKGHFRRARSLLIGSALVVTVTCVAATASNAQSSASRSLAASGPPCKSSFNPYHYTQAQVQACGYSTYPMLAAADLAGGGSSVEYDMNGMTVTNLIPPPGFRPETASAAQLDQYGFPPRPTAPAALASWEKEMSGWTGAAPPTPFLAETHTSVVADTETAPNWAGYVVTAQSNSLHWFTQAEGWYTEPTFASSRCASTSEVTWAGLGGYQSYAGPYLAQNGTAWNSSGADDHQAWWEIVPYNNLTVIGYYATPDQEMDVSTRNVSGGFRFWFYNYEGTSMAFDVTKYGGFAEAQSAEVVVERPTVNGSYANLANFQTLYVDGAAAAEQYNGENSFDTFPANLNSSTGLWRHGVHMVSDTTGHDLADPTSIESGGAFDVTQNSCN